MREALSQMAQIAKKLGIGIQLDLPKIEGF